MTADYDISTSNPEEPHENTPSRKALPASHCTRTDLISRESGLGTRLVPAQAVLDQFDKAQRECADPAKLSAWLPMLGQYGPDLLIQCESSLSLSRELVRTWLESRMFRGVECGNEWARDVSDWLSDHATFKSHSRHLSRSTLREKKLYVVDLEDDYTLEDLSLSVFHATAHTFAASPVVKIVENQTGRAFIKHCLVSQPGPPLLMGVEERAAPD